MPFDGIIFLTFDDFRNELLNFGQGGRSDRDSLFQLFLRVDQIKAMDRAQDRLDRQDNEEESQSCSRWRFSARFSAAGWVPCKGWPHRAPVPVSRDDNRLSSIDEKIVIDLLEKRLRKRFGLRPIRYCCKKTDLLHQTTYN